MVLFVYVYVYVGDNECKLINCKYVINLLCVEKFVKNVYRFILFFWLYYKIIRNWKYLYYYVILNCVKYYIFGVNWGNYRNGLRCFFGFVFIFFINNLFEFLLFVLKYGDKC